MFKFYIKKCYCVVHVLVKRNKTLKNPIYLFSCSCEFRLTMVGFEPKTSRSTSVDVRRLQRHFPYLREIWKLYQKKTFVPKLQKSEEILEFRKKLKFSFSEFRKNRFDNFRSNRSNCKKSLNRLDRFIGQRINRSKQH